MPQRSGVAAALRAGVERAAGDVLVLLLARRRPRPWLPRPAARRRLADPSVTVGDERRATSPRAAPSPSAARRSTRVLAVPGSVVERAADVASLRAARARPAGRAVGRHPHARRGLRPHPRVRARDPGDDRRRPRDRRARQRLAPAGLLRAGQRRPARRARRATRSCSTTTSRSCRAGGRRCAPRSTPAPAVAFPRTIDAFDRDDFAAWCFAVSRDTLERHSAADGEFLDPEHEGVVPGHRPARAPAGGRRPARAGRVGDPCGTRRRRRLERPIRSSRPGSPRRSCATARCSSSAIPASGSSSAPSTERASSLDVRPIAGGRSQVPGHAGR